MNNLRKSLKCGFLGGLLVATCGVQASVITFVTPAGSSTIGGPVSAEATFTTGPGTLDIVLTDLQGNPKDVAQLLSDLDFTLSAALTSGTLNPSSSAGQEVTVGPGGTFTTGGTVSTGWALSSLGGGSFELDVLGTAIGPAHTIIGPPDGSNVYSNANGSIAGNGPHNPFLNQFATFDLLIPGVTADTTITGATFSFGTVAGITVPGTPLPSPAPEPTTLALLGLGLAALGYSSRKRLN